MSCRTRRGFTLVELLVVITIMGILMGLLLVATSNSREAARREKCMQQQEQIALAILQYETKHGHYPGYASDEGSWMGAIVPYIRNDISADACAYLSLAVCPSDEPQDRVGCPTSYVVNCGMEDAGQQDWKSNGVFFNHTAATVEKTDASYVHAHDGISNTLLLSENIQAWDWPQSQWGSAEEGEYKAGFVWSDQDAAGTAAALEAFYINGKMETLGDQGPDITAARPSSHHIDCVVVSFCDGHQKVFVENRENNMDMIVRFLLQTPNGKDAKMPGTGVPVSAYWRTTPLDEGSY